MCLTRMNPYRFEALVMWSRSSADRFTFVEGNPWSTDNERLIGFTTFDPEDEDYNFVILARNKLKRFCAVSMGEGYFTARNAEMMLKKEMIRLSHEKDEFFYQKNEKGAPLELFNPQVPQNKLHPNFIQLTQQKGFSAALGIMKEMAYVLEDRDGNFVKDFQTTGFNSRLWELYLYASLVEQRLNVRMPKEHPDFEVSFHNKRFFIEAVTVNSNEVIYDGVEAVKKYKPDVAELMKNDMPLKFGSTLHSKLSKRYWEKEHIKEFPFVIAIADFHAPMSMTWSGSALSTYLYGIKVEFVENSQGELKPQYIPIQYFEKNDEKIIPFFFQKDAENISAVIFSKQGTLAKFNRMGALADYGDPGIRIIRKGLRFDSNPDAILPRSFIVDVNSPVYNEMWGDEIEVYHNPSAKIPLDPKLLPDFTHHFLEKQKIVSYGKPNTILSSITIMLQVETK